jgi:hypothetical protein
LNYEIAAIVPVPNCLSIVVKQQKEFAMNRNRVSDADLAKLGDFQGQIERNAGFSDQAFNHNLGRSVRVVKTLSYLGLLRQTGKSFPGQIECRAAIRQNFSSSQTMTRMGVATGPMQAAHFMPGQVYIDRHPIWEYATSLTMRGHIEFLFADVEHLPVAFNQADSAAEASDQPVGLCSALSRACGTMIRTIRKNRPGEVGIPMDILEASYNDWHRGAMLAFENAINSKHSKRGVPPLVGNALEGYDPASIAARSSASPSEWNRDTSISVLEYYLEDQRNRRPWPWVFSSCRTAIREVEADFPR